MQLHKSLVLKRFSRGVNLDAIKSAIVFSTSVYKYNFSLNFVKNMSAVNKNVVPVGHQTTHLATLKRNNSYVLNWLGNLVINTDNLATQLCRINV